MTTMLIADPDVDLVAIEGDILDELLPLTGAAVLELGCGKAEKTRHVAKKAASVLALEVDEIQLARNMEDRTLVNVTFAYGAAERIPADDSIFDIVLMFKSLHHVPVDQMDRAFAEIHRVLKPGGIAYISEPVYAGNFNEIIRLFNDEKTVREAAFKAEQRAVSSGLLNLVRQKFFLQPMHFDSFAEFEALTIKATHSNHRLSAALYEEVRVRFERQQKKSGFSMPIRADVLRKPDHV